MFTDFSLYGCRTIIFVVGIRKLTIIDVIYYIIQKLAVVKYLQLHS